LCHDARIHERQGISLHLFRVPAVVVFMPLLQLTPVSMTLNSGWLLRSDEAVCALKLSHILGWISAGGEAALYAGRATRIECWFGHGGLAMPALAGSKLPRSASLWRIAVLHPTTPATFRYLCAG